MDGKLIFFYLTLLFRNLDLQMTLTFKASFVEDKHTEVKVR